MSATVTVVNQQATVLVVNTDNGSSAAVESACVSTVAVNSMGVRGLQGPQGPLGPTGPQGPSGTLEDGFTIDGGNF